MVLRKTTILLVCFVFKTFSHEHNFHYNVETLLKKDQSLLETFSDLVSESEVESEIKQLRTFSQKSKPINSMTALKDRIANDTVTIHKIAHVMGFYGAVVTHKIHIDEQKNVNVKIHIDLQKKFKLKLNVRYINKDSEFNKTYASLLQKKLRLFKASIEEIKSLIKIAVRDLQKDGFFNPEIIEKRVYINYEAGEATLHLAIDPKQKVFFSDVKIKSFPGISNDFVQNRITWEKGNIFDIEQIELTAENLKNTQIFSNIKIKPDKKAVLKDEVPINIELEEDKKHLIDVGLLYSGARNMNFEKGSKTQKKLKSIIARLTWINYNIFGGGEKLSFIVEGIPMKIREKRSDYAFETILSQPDVFLKNNTADYGASRRQELTNAFFKKNDRESLIFNYLLVNNVLAKTGCSFEKNYIDTSEIFFHDNHNEKKYKNFSIPMEFIINKTDDLLNPTSGYKIRAKFLNMFLTKSAVKNLQTFDIDFSYNYSLDDLKLTVIAFNLSGKSILCGGIDNIPVDKRIYAGGMGSVRGYANQMATEVIIGDDIPMGGKSSIEFNNEIRRKLSTNFGIVLFFDGAKVFQNKSRHDYLRIEKKRWFFSVGTGIRYFTSIGPIRIDFAFPLRKRKSIDSKIQFIMSLGQAF